MNTILLIWLLVFIIEFLIDWSLDILNISTILKNRGSIPPAFNGLITEFRLHRSADYSLRKARFGLFTGIQSRLVVIIVLTRGGAGALDTFTEMLSGGSSPYWHGLLFLALSSLALTIIGLPASLYSRFVIEEEFGFNTAGFRTFLADTLKSLILGGILLMALLAGIHAARTWFDSLWWLIAWAFFTLFQLLLTVIYPVLIAPLFNRFEPLAEGELKTRLETLARRCRFAVGGIYTMDGSRRSRHSNAYFTGIGRLRRIVIFDTLIDTLSIDELEAVLAHEIGHWKHGHIRRGLIISVAVSLILFALAGIALEQPPLYRAFGLNGPSLHGLIFLLTFFAAPFTSFLTPLANALSRHHEYQADRFAAARTGGPAAMRAALLQLSRDNLSNLTPHPAYSAWHYSHPAPAERLAALGTPAPGPDTALESGSPPRAEPRET